MTWLAARTGWAPPQALAWGAATFAADGSGYEATLQLIGDSLGCGSVALLDGRVIDAGELADTGILLSWARALQAAGAPKSAESVLRYAGIAAPRDPDVPAVRASIAAASGRHRSALALLKQALALELSGDTRQSRCIAAALRRAEWHLSTSENEYALWEFQAAAARAPRWEPSRVGIAESLQGLGRYLEALDAYRECEAIDRVAQAGRAGTVDALTHLGRYRQALQAAHGLIAAAPDAPWTYLAAVDLHLALRQHDEALRLLLEGAALCDTSQDKARFARTLASYWTDIGDFDKASDQLTTAEQLEWDAPYLPLRRAEYWRARGDLDKAHAELEQAIDRGVPGDNAAAERCLQAITGRHDAALSALRIFLESQRSFLYLDLLVTELRKLRGSGDPAIIFSGLRMIRAARRRLLSRYRTGARPERGRS